MLDCIYKIQADRLCMTVKAEQVLEDTHWACIRVVCGGRLCVVS